MSSNLPQNYLITTLLINDPAFESFLKYLTRVILYPYVCPPLLITLLTNYQNRFSCHSINHNINVKYIDNYYGSITSPTIESFEVRDQVPTLTTRRITATATAFSDLLITLRYGNNTSTTHTIPFKLLARYNFIIDYLKSNNAPPVYQDTQVYTPLQSMQLLSHALYKTFNLLDSTLISPIQIHAYQFPDATLATLPQQHETPMKHALLSHASILPTVLSYNTNSYIMHNMPPTCINLRIHAFTSGTSPSHTQEYFNLFFTAIYSVPKRFLPSVKHIATQQLPLGTTPPSNSWASLPQEIDDEIFIMQLKQLFTSECEYSERLTHPRRRSNRPRILAYPLNVMTQWQNDTTVILSLRCVLSCDEQSRLAISSSSFREASKYPDVPTILCSIKHLTEHAPFDEIPSAFPPSTSFPPDQNTSDINDLYSLIAQKLCTMPLCTHPGPTAALDYPPDSRRLRMNKKQFKERVSLLLSDCNYSSSDDSSEEESQSDDD